MSRKKKLIIGSISLVLIAMAMIGTLAYFTKSFTSDGNVATAAIFDVDVTNQDGDTIADGQFDLGEDLYPGMDKKQVYSFQIEKNQTSVPVEYEVLLNKSGGLFPADESSPVVLTLGRKVEGEWSEVDNLTFKPEYDVEEFRIFVEWPHSEHDINFQGLKGNIALEVIATQVDEEVVTGPPYRTGEIAFKVLRHSSTRVTTDQEINFYFDEDGKRVIEVTVAEGDGDFETRVGSFTVTEEENDAGNKFYRVITEHEYYASDRSLWRVFQDNLDLSTPGVVLFPQGTFETHLKIESQELYNWMSE